MNEGIMGYHAPVMNLQSFEVVGFFHKFCPLLPLSIKRPYFFWGQVSLPRWQVICLLQLSAALLAYFLI